MHALAGVSLRSAVISRRSACRPLTVMDMSALIRRRISSSAVRNRRSAGRMATASRMRRRDGEMLVVVC